MKRKSSEAAEDGAAPQVNGIVSLTRAPWGTGVSPRGSVEPPDHKRCVLPIILQQKG
jgi:hypothetical protein